MPFRGNEIEIPNYSNMVTREEAHTVFVNQAGDVMLGNLNMSNYKLQNAELENCSQSQLATADSHLVNKAYLDSRLIGLDSVYVNESGDTLEGTLRMSRNKITGLPYPTEETEAVNKKYADRHRSHFTFGENTLQMQKPIDMNSKTINELADPTDDADAVNKRYVDNLLTSRQQTAAPRRPMNFGDLSPIFIPFRTPKLNGAAERRFVEYSERFDLSHIKLTNWDGDEVMIDSSKPETLNYVYVIATLYGPYPDTSNETLMDTVWVTNKKFVESRLEITFRIVSNLRIYNRGIEGMLVLSALGIPIGTATFRSNHQTPSTYILSEDAEAALH